MPEMIYVDSSNVEAIGYDADTLQLYVQFKAGTTYVYYDVEQFVFEEFKMTDSKGRFVTSRIKNIYSYYKM